MRYSTLTGLLTVVGVLVAAAALGWWWRRRDGRIRPVTDDGRPAPFAPDSPVSRLLAGIEVRAGSVTLVQFSSALCAPCRTTRRVLAEIERRVDGIHVVEVDVERHLDVSRELDIWRTPTVLVVDTTGRVTQRVSGVPGRDALIAALRPLLVGPAR